MKKLIYIALLALTVQACRLEETNVNPNVPVDVPLETLLPPAEFGVSEALGGRAFRYTNIFSQHMQGTNNQDLQTERYNPDELFVGYLWEDFYAGPMINLRILIDKAELEASPHYAGIGKVLLANCLGVVTDIWGDVPYSEALQGAEQTQPSYDGQSAIYQSIQSLLDEAIADLSQAESVFSPAGDDVIYNGDISKWRKAAHALKARYYLHTTRVDQDAAAKVISELNGAMTSSSDDLAYPYLGTEVDAHPVYQYFQITPDAIVDPTFVVRLGSADPRFEYFIDIIPFSGGLSKPGPGIAGQASPLTFIGFVEQKFIEAEAYARTSSTALAESALHAAVTSSIETGTLGNATSEEIDDYLANLELTGDQEGDLEIILTEKYKALFTHTEPWVDYRRTGIPDLQPNQDGDNAANPGGDIPRRLIYPQSERLYNPNIPSPLPDMQDRMWWDPL